MSSIDYILTLADLYDGVYYGWKLDDKPIIYLKDKFKVLHFNNIPYLDGYDNQNAKEVKYYLRNN